MTDKNGTATTTWQDNHSGLRRHKLMTKELGDTIPALYANENVEDHDAVVARVKLFSPYNGWRWYITEWEAETGLCFGLVGGVRNGVGLLLAGRAGGGDRVRPGARRGARPVLGAADPRRDQEAGVGAGGLAVNGHGGNQKRNRGRRYHA